MAERGAAGAGFALDFENGQRFGWRLGRLRYGIERVMVYFLANLRARDLAERT